MRAFVFIAVCLVAMASAAPQYGYGFQPLPIPPQQPQQLQQLQQPQQLQQLQQPQQSQQPQQYADALSPAGPNQGGDKYLPPTATTPEPIVRKQFYLISAPDDSANQPRQKHLVLGRPQKNYRVVFIKAPSADSDNVKYSAEYAPQEDKTVIYVLTKKEKDLDASDISTPEPQEASKPEVFFIKYKTPEEAEAAQREIQNEYDKLGGTNEYADEATAPITSVVGALDGLTPDGAYNYRQIAPARNPAPAPASGSQPHGSRQRSAISDYLPSITK